MGQKKKIDQFEIVNIDKLVHGGQGIGTLDDGRKAFIWNTLPGETVKARLTKTKKDFVEGVAEEIVSASTDRIKPKESIYLATSPWQMMTLVAENKYKKAIVSETFLREGVVLPSFDMVSDGKMYEYRNKMEFSFYGDDDGVHFAFYNRGTHQKQIVQDSALALPAINFAANNLIKEFNKIDIRAGDLKSVIVRTAQSGKTVGALFVKTLNFPDIKLPSGLDGLKIYHSNPRSPASVATKLIRTLGDTELSDILLGSSISYDVIGFFQVNLPVFESALKRIDHFTSKYDNKVDLYSGVGTIGIPIGGTKTLVELDQANASMARRNVGNQQIEVVHASSETALAYIVADSCLVVDPPRSGLHKEVINRILDIKPKLVCYLSCNPSTQARDVALLSNTYKINFFEEYNFFPRTPHIETLCILELI
jgi:23S rRNA (uracil1939-C5)-methyltransferase